MKPLQIFWKILKKIFKYLEPLWTGADGRISLRACLSIYFSWKLVQNLDYVIMKWASDRSIAGTDSNLLILAGLIAALLGLSTWQNTVDKKTEIQATNPPPVSDIINVQSAQNVGAKTTAETVNAAKVETINTNSTVIGQKIDNPDG